MLMAPVWTWKYGICGWSPPWQTSADDTNYVFREITIAPGGSTGWHWHHGRRYGVMKQGTEAQHISDCTIEGSIKPVTASPNPAKRTMSGSIASSAAPR